MKAGFSHKGNPNLLFTDFKGLSDYDPEDFYILNFRKSPGYKKKNGAISTTVSAASPVFSTEDGDFSKISLDEQIQAMMRPITNPELKVRKIERQLQEKELSAALQQHEVMLATEQANKSSALMAELTLVQEMNSFANNNLQTEKEKEVTKSQLEPKSFQVLSDPMLDNANKFWHFKQPLKNQPNSTRNQSLNNSTMSDRRRQNENHSPDRTQARNKNMSPLEMSKIEKSPEMKEMKPLKTYQRLPYIEMKDIKTKMENSPDKYSMELDIIKQLDGSKKEEGGIMGSKNINHLHSASHEANHLLKAQGNQGTIGSMNKKLLDYSQERSRHIFSDADKRMRSVPNVPEDYLETSEYNISQASIKTTKNRNKLPFLAGNAAAKRNESPGNRKKYYNKWFVPVKYWSMEKEEDTKVVKYEQLKKDINYFYHNLHNFHDPKALSLISGNKHPSLKSIQKMNYDSLQDKLKHDLTIKRYKKQLADHHVRIPIFLKTIDEEEQN